MGTKIKPIENELVKVELKRSIENQRASEKTKTNIKECGRNTKLKELLIDRNEISRN